RRSGAPVDAPHRPRAAQRRLTLTRTRRPMINVNLRPNLKRKRARSPLQGIGESVRGLGAKIKDPILLLAVVSWVGVGGFLGFVFVGTTRELGALEPQLEQTRSEHRRFRAFLTE